MESVMPIDAARVITIRILGVPDPTAPGSNKLSDVPSDRELPHHKGPRNPEA